MTSQEVKKLFNSSFKRFALPCMTAALLVLTARVARADVVVTLEQVGSNVVATASGTLDLTDLTTLGAAVITHYIDPSLAALLMGPGSAGVMNVYSGITGPTSFGSGAATLPSSGSGDNVGIFGQSGSQELWVPENYNSGTSISSNDTWDNTTLSALGVTDGTYTWTWGTGAHADSFTLEVGPTAVTPEPSSLVLLGLVLVGLLIAKRRFAFTETKSAQIR